MVVIMCEQLRLEEGNKVLEVGAGSGYHAAICAEIVAPPASNNPGYVYSVERISSLAKWARENLKRTGYANRVKVIVGDGTMGYREAMPYDRILVTGFGAENTRTTGRTAESRGHNGNTDRGKVWLARACSCQESERGRSCYN